MPVNVMWKISLWTQGASEVLNTVKTPLWFIFAEMLMSESSDRSSGNRIVCTVCKVYNVIYVSNMKGYGLLERNTRGASKNLSLIYQHCKRGIFIFVGVSCENAFSNEALTLRELRFRFNAATADIAWKILKFISQNLFQNILCFLCRSERGFPTYSKLRSWRTVSLIWCRR